MIIDLSDRLFWLATFIVLWKFADDIRVLYHYYKDTEEESSIEPV